jgi:Zn-dependent peptidase ImmA (M78 family)
MNIALLEKFCNDNDIFSIAYQKAVGFKGIAVDYKGKKIIAYRDDLPAEEKYYIFAHEIGHHVMQHLTTRKKQRTAEEVEADVFASVLMALSVFAEMRGAITT